MLLQRLFANHWISKLKMQIAIERIIEACPNSVADGPQTHVIVLSVDSYGGARDDHKSFSASGDTLQNFWSDASKGVRCYSIQNSPIASITRVKLTVGGDASHLKLLVELKDLAKSIRRKDNLVFHWVGHGLAYWKDNFLELPLLDGQQDSDREYFDIAHFAYWVGWEFEAYSQFFFIDACSTKLSEERPRHLPEIPSERQAQHASPRSQYILIGSGVNRPALAPRGHEPSLFTEALICTLESLPSVNAGEHFERDTFRMTLATWIQSCFFRDKKIGLPYKYELEAEAWDQSFVTDYTGIDSAHRWKWSQAPYLGETTEQKTACCIWCIEEAQKNPLEVAAKHGLVSEKYTLAPYDRYNAYGVIGLLERGEQIEVVVRFEGTEVSKMNEKSSAPYICEPLEFD